MGRSLRSSDITTQKRWPDALLRKGVGLTDYGVVKAIGKALRNAYLASTSLAKECGDRR